MKTKWLQNFLTERGGIEGHTYDYIEGNVCGFLCMNGKLSPDDKPNPLSFEVNLPTKEKSTFDNSIQDLLSGINENIRENVFKYLPSWYNKFVDKFNLSKMLNEILHHDSTTMDKMKIEMKDMLACDNSHGFLERIQQWLSGFLASIERSPQYQILTNDIGGKERIDVLQSLRNGFYVGESFKNQLKMKLLLYDFCVLSITVLWDIIYFYDITNGRLAKHVNDKKPCNVDDERKTVNKRRRTRVRKIV
jgi:hypothetical protein